MWEAFLYQSHLLKLFRSSTGTQLPASELGRDGSGVM